MRCWVFLLDNKRDESVRTLPGLHCMLVTSRQDVHREASCETQPPQYSRSGLRAMFHLPDLCACLSLIRRPSCTTFRTDPVQVRSCFNHLCSPIINVLCTKRAIKVGYYTQHASLGIRQ
ncbi:hypothetical protein SUGI_0223280 [Cryptomeria japonica]|nr:hypothetical protein SUGI_0223280 [Cryptomeria japonica]